MKKTNNIDSNPRIKMLAILLLLGGPILFAILINNRDYSKDSEIDKNLATGKAIITNVTLGRSPDITWRYNVDGKEYEGHALDTRSFNFVEYCPDKTCIGDTVQIEYSIKKPENSRMVFHGMRSYR